MVFTGTYNLNFPDLNKLVSQAPSLRLHGTGGAFRGRPRSSPPGVRFPAGEFFGHRGGAEPGSSAQTVP